jgi:predicted dehydrogenase
MERVYGVGVVGYGGYGSFLVRCWKGLSRVRVVAIAGRNPMGVRAAAEELGVERHYVGHQQLIDDPDIEIVAVATPPFTHAEIGVLAAQAGKHIYCEKPMATAMPDAVRLAEAANHHGVRLCMGFVMRYHPTFARLKRTVERGLLGDLHRIDFANFAADECLPPNHWFWDRTRSGGILVEHGVHFFDVYSWLTGAPVARVTGHKTVRPGTSQEDRVLATVEYGNGVLATFYHAFDKPALLERTWCTLAFDRGYVHVHGWVPTYLELEAGLEPGQLGELEAVLPGLEVLERAEPGADGSLARGGGNEYKLDALVRCRFREGEKQALYAQCVRDSMADLLQAIDDPAHRVRAGAPEGLRSLEMALSI